MTPRRPTTVRLGARLARRELLRRPWRSFLVLLMVFVPTLVMTGAVIVLRTSEWSASEHRAADYGQADAIATFIGGVPTPEQLDQLRAGVPEGSRVVVEHTARDRVRGDDRSIHLTISDQPLDDPISAGRFDGLLGRVPTGGGEVVVNAAAARLLDVEIGDAIAPQRLDRSLEVVGTVRTLSTDVNEAVVYVGSLTDAVNGSSTAFVDLPGPPRALDPRTGTPRDLPPIPGWTLVGRSSSEVNHTPAVFLSYAAGGVGLGVLATIIAATFAIGARGQLRTIGLLSSSGASPRTIKWFVVAQGAIIGALGAFAGILVGVIAARLTPPRLLDSLANRPVGEPVSRPADLVPILLIGTLVAAVAAWLPARQSAKISTVQALAGRRPEGRVPPLVPACGAASIGLGLALLVLAVPGESYGPSLQALAAIAGGLAVLLGAIAIAPRIVAGIERTSAEWPESWRLAGRSLARSRVRSSAVIGAVVAVSVSVVAGITLYGSLKPDSGGSQRVAVPNQRQNQIVLEMLDTQGGESLPIPDEILHRVLSVAPDARLVRPTDVVPAGVEDGESGAVFASYVSGTDERDREGARVGIATPQLLDALEVPGDLRAALGRGEAISAVRPPFETHEVKLVLPEPDGRQRLPLAGSFDSPAASTWLPAVLVSPARAESLGLVGRPAPWTVLRLPEAITDRQRDALELISDDIEWEQSTQPIRQFHFNILLPSDNFQISWAAVKAILLGLALVFVFAIVAVGLALAARDSEDERQVLSAVGAPPRTLHRVGALRAVLLVTTAVVIAVPAALLSSVVIVAADDAEHALRIDFWAVLFVVVVVPVVVGLVVWAGAWLRDALRPTRPDVFAISE